MRERDLKIQFDCKRLKYHVVEMGVGVVFISRKMAEVEEYIQENKYRRSA